MTIGLVLKPWSFVNNTETADATKVNSNFDIVFALLNELIVAINAASGDKATLADRLNIMFNADGTLLAFPDYRTSRVLIASGTTIATDCILYMNTIAGDLTLTLPSAAVSAQRLTIVNTGLTGYTVTIVPQAGNTVQGLAQIQLALAGESIGIAPNGIDWQRVD